MYTRISNYCEELPHGVSSNLALAPHNSFTCTTNAKFCITEWDRGRVKGMLTAISFIFALITITFSVANAERR